MNYIILLLHAQMVILAFFLLNIHIHLTLNKITPSPISLKFQIKILDMAFLHTHIESLTHCPCKYFVSPQLTSISNNHLLQYTMD
jgi:hypothetical protein